MSKVLYIALIFCFGCVLGVIGTVIFIKPDDMPENQLAHEMDSVLHWADLQKERADSLAMIRQKIDTVIKVRYVKIEKRHREIDSLPIDSTIHFLERVYGTELRTAEADPIGG